MSDGTEFQRQLEILKRGEPKFAIKMQRWGTRHKNFWHLHTWRLRVIVERTLGGMTEHIFVYERQPVNAAGEILDEFQGVASPIDLEVLPFGSPAAGETLFRSDTVEIDLESQQDYDVAWENLKTQICALIDVLNGEERAQELTVWCNEPEVTESESLSESVSESVSASVSESI
jgi:hypothetical protein